MDSDGDRENPKIQWYVRNEFKSVKFKVTQSFDVFSHEVMQRDMTFFSGTHESN